MSYSNYSSRKPPAVEQQVRLAVRAALLPTCVRCIIIAITFLSACLEHVILPSLGSFGLQHTQFSSRLWNQTPRLHFLAALLACIYCSSVRHPWLQKSALEKASRKDVPNSPFFRALSRKQNLHQRSYILAPQHATAASASVQSPFLGAA